MREAETLTLETLHSICAYAIEICIVTCGISSMRHATGYNADICGNRHKLACRHKDIRRYPWCMPSVHMISARHLAHSQCTPLHRRHMQNTFVNTTWWGTNPRRLFSHGASSKLSTNMEHVSTYGWSICNLGRKPQLGTRHMGQHGKHVTGLWNHMHSL